MASVVKSYYLLSHKLNGVFARLEGLENLLLYKIPVDESMRLEMVKVSFAEGRRLIEELRQVLEFRARHRHNKNQMYLSMLSTLYEQIDKDPAAICTEEILTEINLFADEVKEEMYYNLDLEKKR